MKLPVARAGLGLAMAFLTSAALAAPVQPAATGLGAHARQGAALVERVVFQCVWVRGVRRCRWVQGVPRPEAYPTGSRDWWRAMEDWGRSGGSRR